MSLEARANASTPRADLETTFHVNIGKLEEHFRLKSQPVSLDGHKKILYTSSLGSENVVFSVTTGDQAEGLLGIWGEVSPHSSGISSRTPRVAQISISVVSLAGHVYRATTILVPAVQILGPPLRFPLIRVGNWEASRELQSENAVLLRVYATTSSKVEPSALRPALLDLVTKTIRQTGADTTDILFFVFNGRDSSGNLYERSSLAMSKTFLKDCRNLYDVLTGQSTSNLFRSAWAEPQNPVVRTEYLEYDSDFEELDDEAQVDNGHSVPVEGRRRGSRATSTWLVTGAAAKSWEAFLFYLYTGIVEFAPLSSIDKRKRTSYVKRYILKNPGRPAPCSPKSMYRLAIELGQSSLEELALANIRQQLTNGNVLFELMSPFSARYEKVRNVLMDYLDVHWGTIQKSADLARVMGEVVKGTYPHAHEVLVELLRRDNGRQNNSVESGGGSSNAMHNLSTARGHGGRNASQIDTGQLTVLYASPWKSNVEDMKQDDDDSDDLYMDPEDHRTGEDRGGAANLDLLDDNSDFDNNETGDIVDPVGGRSRPLASPGPLSGKIPEVILHARRRLRGESRKQRRTGRGIYERGAGGSKEAKATAQSAHLMSSDEVLAGAAPRRPQRSGMSRRPQESSSRICDRCLEARVSDTGCVCPYQGAACKRCKKRKVRCSLSDHVPGRRRGIDHDVPTE